MIQSKRKLKVLELIDDADIGGGQRHVLLLAEGLHKRKIDVSVACAPSGFLVDELNKVGIRVHPLLMSNRLQLLHFFHLVRLLRDEQFTVVHTHGGTAGFWGRLAAYLTDVPVCIHTYHGIHSAYRKNPVFRVLSLTLERLLKLCTTHSICVSQGDVQLATQHKLVYERNSTVIPNGIEVERFAKSNGRQQIRAEFGISNDEIFVGTIGRLHFQKGLVYFLEAVQDVARQTQSVRFVLVGDGPQKELLHEKAVKLGISNVVRFVGTRHDVPNLLAAFDIFVLSSLWEGLPLVLLEASAAGKAIVATRVDGTKEIVQDGVNGLLVPSEDSRSLASALLKVSEDSSLRARLGAKAQEIALTTYSADRMVEQTMNLYIEVGKNHGIG